MMNEAKDFSEHLLDLRNSLEDAASYANRLGKSDLSGRLREEVRTLDRSIIFWERGAHISPTETRNDR